MGQMKNWRNNAFFITVITVPIVLMTVLLGNRNRPQSQEVVPVYTNKRLYCCQIRQNTQPLLIQPFSPTVLCACVYSLYLTRLCKLHSPEETKELFLWRTSFRTCNDRLGWVRETSVNTMKPA